MKEHIAEIGLDPYTLSTMHFGAQNFVTTMILGGVFERHPDLRVGVIELTSHWVGPMVENLTGWRDMFAKRLAGTLSLSPSEYLSRNVRVSSFYWEPVDKFIERFGLEDVYVFSSDYPHVEGGIDTAQAFADRLKRLGPDLIEKYFVTNADLLLPA
jgi:predicted TIM-barrel fold metal-dependent hydrolase